MNAALWLLAATVAFAQDGAGWKPMFDGSSLDGWGETQFSERGKVRVEEGAVVLERGRMTGIHWTKAFPSTNYELRLEAMKTAGNDFFAGITFPVGKSSCSWINGGWGGTIVGLSSVDFMDASENETSLRRTFETERWYRLYLRVTPSKIQAWIDDEAVIDFEIGNHEISLRLGEIELSRPLGIASYRTASKLRKIEFRVIPEVSK